MFIIALITTVLAFVQNLLMFVFGLKESAIFAFPLSFTGIFLGEIAAIWTGYFCAHRFLRRRRLLALAGVQTSENGHFRPIGSDGFCHRGGTRAIFDQQPIEAQAMVSACLEAYRTTSDSWWYEQAQRAFDWFLGWNDLGLELHSVNTGGCRDALHVDRVNGNQGAESTLAFLLSLAEMQLMQNAVTVFNEPAS